MLPAATEVLSPCRGALLSLNPGTLGGALSPALMSNSTLATIQGQWGPGSLDGGIPLSCGWDHIVPRSVQRTPLSQGADLGVLWGTRTCILVPSKGSRGL